MLLTFPLEGTARVVGRDGAVTPNGALLIIRSTLPAKPFLLSTVTVALRLVPQSPAISVGDTVRDIAGLGGVVG
jgi:hypothetical protein